MKNLSKIVSIAAIIASVVSTSAEAAMPIARLNSDQVLLTKAVNKNEFGITNTGNQNLNVRKSASTNSELLGKLPTGSKVEIVDKLANGWYKIKYKSSYGYVDSRYVIISVAVNEFGITNTGNQNLNVRKSASTNSELLGKLPTGSKVEIVDKLANGWYRIKYKSSYGYVDSKYIDSKIPISVTGVKLNKATLSLEKGKSETLKATISPSNASNKGVTWTSSNSKVATVDKNGKVKAISKGTATIIVKTKDKGKTAKCTVTVNDISKARQKILDNARKMVYFEWSPKYQFSAWRAQKTFKPGTKYKGIPYTQNVQVKNTSEFISKINSRKDLTVVIGGITMPRYGNDCSGFISAVWQIPRQTTPNLKNGNYTTKLNNFNELQPGDAIVTITPWEKRHVRLFVRWADSSKTKMVVYEQTPPQAKESTYSVSDLKVKGYTPIRLKDEYLNKIK